MVDSPAASPLEELAGHIATSAARLVRDAAVREGEIVISADADRLVELMRFLRDDPRCRFQQLIDICGVDWPQRDPRFDVVYHLLSLATNRRVRVKIATGETTPVPSISSVWSAAGWFERETWDL